MKKQLLTKEKNSTYTKDIVIFNNPDKMKAVLNETRWQILKLLAHEPQFPAQIARAMKLHEQKIYYHIRKLIDAGLVQVAYEKEIRGAKAKFYKTVELNFGLELHPEDKGMEYSNSKISDIQLTRFFSEFYSDGQFNGLIVVGDPDPHGPHKTWARDGHYAIHLAMFLGQFLPPPEDLFVKLDVEVRAEKILDQNLILIGGPAVNLVTADINSKLAKSVFDNRIKGIAPEASFGRGITSKDPKVFYSKNTIGTIFKEPNPYDPDKTIIAFAGQGRRGTKAAILALTNNWKEILRTYDSGSYKIVVEGYDLDGNGTIDSVEILE